jgi:excinuclease UvrABC nuclease subunit
MAKTIYPGKYYVYQWLDADGKCLYIGSGKNGRAWYHADKPNYHKEKSITIRLLLWAEKKDALVYEQMLIARLAPKWNIVGQRPAYNTVLRPSSYHVAASNERPLAAKPSRRWVYIH